MRKKLKSDSILVGSESKSLNRPRSSKINKDQRPKTANSILCKTPVPEIKTQIVEKDSELKNKNLKILNKKNCEKNFGITNKGSTTVKKDLNQLKPKV